MISAIPAGYNGRPDPRMGVTPRAYGQATVFPDSDLVAPRGTVMPGSHSSASHSPRPERIPRAGLDPIWSARDALAVFALQVSRPPALETLVMFIDSSGCGLSLVTVSDTTRPEQVVDVAETMAMAVADHADVSGLVLASVRPSGGVLADDDTLWFQIDAAVEGQGLVLFDWLVIGRDGTRSMVDELGVPTRWPSRT